MSALDTLFKVSLVMDLVDRVTKPLDKITEKVETLDDVALNFEKLGPAIGGVGAGITYMMKGFVDASGQMQTYNSTFETIFKGNKKLAINTLDEITTYAANTPFQLPDSIELGKQLLTLKRYAVSTMTDLGDLASAADKPLKQASSAYAKLATGQKGQAVEMFRDLLITTDDWVKATGKGISKNGELLATTEEMLAVLPKILKDKGFSGMMAKQSKDFKGIMSNFNDSLFKFQSIFGSSLLAPVGLFFNLIGNIINGLAAWGKAHPILSGLIMHFIGVVGLLSLGLGVLLILYAGISKFKKDIGLQTRALSNSFSFLTKKIWENITANSVMQSTLYQMKLAQMAGLSGFKVFGVGLKTFTSGIGVAATGIKTSLISSIMAAIPAVWAFTVSLLACPITWIVIGVLALAGAVFLLYKNWDKVKGALDKIFQPFITQVKILWNNLKSLWHSIPGWMKPVLLIMGLIFAPYITLPILIAKNFTKIKQFFGDLWQNISGGFSGFIDSMLFGIGYLTGLLIGIPTLIATAYLKAVNKLFDIGRSIPSKLKNSFKFFFGDNDGSIKKIPQFDKGVENFAGGLAYVHKDELIELPNGSNVYTKNETKRMVRKPSSYQSDSDSNSNKENKIVNYYYQIDNVTVQSDDIRSLLDFFRMIEQEA